MNDKGLSNPPAEVSNPFEKVGPNAPLALKCASAWSTKIGALQKEGSLVAKAKSTLNDLKLGIDCHDVNEFTCAVRPSHLEGYIFVHLTLEDVIFLFLR